METTKARKIIVYHFDLSIFLFFLFIAFINRSVTLQPREETRCEKLFFVVKSKT